MIKDFTSAAVLQDYLGGKLDPQDMYQVERHALEDPFVFEALQGLSDSPDQSLQSISLLQKQLHARVAEQKLHKKESVITWQRLSIAATAAVLFIAVSTIFWMKKNATPGEAAGAEKAVTVTTFVTSAQPVGGYSVYQEYLEQNNRLKGSRVNEEVSLTFQVQPDGRATAFEISKSPGQTYSEEAVRLIKEGPRWELPSNAGEKVSLSISF